MGGGGSILYNVPITQKKQGETPILRHPQYKNGLHDKIEPNIRTLKQIFINCLNQYANNPALGKIVRKENNATIEFLTYKQVITQAQYLGSSIVRRKLFNQPQGEDMKFIGLFSKNRAEWTITDIAACLYKFVTIPIYDTLGDENITYVFKHTQLTTCFINSGGLKSLQKTHDLVKIANLVCFDPFTEEEVKYFEEKGIKLIPYAELISEGEKNPVDYRQPQFNVAPKDIITFSYTSGTTGPPKGAMITHNNFVSFIQAAKINKDAHFDSSDVGLSYLPLPHILQRQFDYSLLQTGARIVYFSGDVQKLKDDLAIVKPTIFVSVPRLFSRFYQVLQGKFNEVRGWTKTALDYALWVKMQNLDKNGSVTHKVYDKLFFSKTRDALGGKVRLMISGSAPLLPEVQKFMKVTMCAPLCEGYGQTQSTGAMLFTDGDDPVVKHVGGPVSNFEIKLVDIPEMNYLSTDTNQEGLSTPRGEIWCRGPGVFAGYYHDEVKTKEALTEDGWLKTGDIGELLPGSRGVRIIDRKKNIFKLQQGEYVAAEKVQNTYLKGDKIAEIYIHGQSTETFVIAIVVPHKKAVHQFAQARKIEGSYEELCANEGIRADFVSYLNKIGKENGLQGFEQVKNLHLETEPFQARDIVTTTMKVQRHQAKKFYWSVIEGMYKEGMLKIDKK